jgi:hypothetical protein
MKWIDAYIRFTLRTFVWGAHGALISAAFFTVKLSREGNYGPALVFGLFATALTVFLIFWWRNHLEDSN